MMVVMNIPVCLISANLSLNVGNVGRRTSAAAAASMDAATSARAAATTTRAAARTTRWTMGFLQELILVRRTG